MKKIDSTNRYLKDHSELWNENFNTVYTFNQTEGKGQHNREWISEAGKDLAFSIIFSPEKRLLKNSLVAFYTGIAVYAALLNYLDDNLKVKWPNDIYYNDAKLGGILCEKVIANNSEKIIIGIGININSYKDKAKSGFNSISMQQITGITYNPEFILNDLLKEIRIILNKILFPIEEEVLLRWKSISASIGKSILFEINNHPRSGIFKSLNHDLSFEIFDLETQETINYKKNIIFN